jgi:hypothetical protein
VYIHLTQFFCALAWQGYYGGGFHGGSSEILDDDDGEILVVPGPMSRNSADFETAMLAEHGYGPGYRPPGTGNHHTRQRSQQGYVVGEGT